MQRVVNLFLKNSCIVRNSTKTISSLRNDSIQFSPLNNSLPIPSVYDIHPDLHNNIKDTSLPAFENARQVYSFPTANKYGITAPPYVNNLEEKVDPLTNESVKCPSALTSVAIQLAPRLLTIRRKKMKKHKRRKRYDRDYFKYQKYHREKKMKAEREFIRRMKKHLAELTDFNSEKYVESTLAEAKKEWNEELAPTGRKLYPHWSRLMTIEELYGLDKDDFIDKKAGYPSEEDLEKIKNMKLEYVNKFRKV